jgi:exodeoxyribonuclease-3
MREITLLSWNVNGIRAVQRKGFPEWFEKQKPEILCLQETKARPEQLDDELVNVPGYESYWNYPEKKGYAGVALYTQEKPREVKYDLGEGKIDTEGRVIMAEYEEFTLFNIYFPNGGAGNKRVPYKMEFYDAFLEYADSMAKAGRKLVICGDFNTAHKEIDLARPKENVNNTGFLPEERAWMDKFTAHGYIDTFRQFNKEPGQYSYWDMKTRARDRNVGWRIDYFYTTENLLASITGAFIMPEVMGSDHCPVGITLRI